MQRSWWKYLLAVTVLVAGYYFILGLVIERLPYVDVPHRWKNVWPSNTAAVFSWFQVLNFVGALSAAFPSALLISWKARKRPFLVAFVVSIATAVIVVAPTLYPEREATYETHVWLNLACYFFFIAVGNLCWVWLVGYLPPNQAFTRGGEELIRLLGKH